MIVYVAGALIAIAYLCCLPLTARLDAEASFSPAFASARLGLGLFDGTRMLTVALGLPSGGAPKPADFAGFPLRRVLRAFGFLRDRTRVKRLYARVSAGDACHTALACGVLAGLFSLTKLPGRAEPDFAAGAPAARLSCIVSARLGHIILAALSCALILTQWRIKTWRSARLKAS